MDEITAAQLGEDLMDEEGKDGRLILDIRPGHEFEEWHIPGSAHINLYETLKREPEEARGPLDTLPSDKEIVTVCAGGVVSQIATRLLRDMGYEARTLAGGMSGWSRVHLVAPVDFEGAGRLLQVARPGSGCLSYVLVSGGEAAVFDPSRYQKTYDGLFARHEATPVGVFETHAHADHISGARELAASHGVSHYRHPGDRGAVKTITGLRDNQQLWVGHVEIKVLHTPGHTPGSVVYRIGNQVLLTGDTLFLEGVGRPDLEGSDADVIRGRSENLYRSLERLLDQSDQSRVAPAHYPENPLPPVTATLGETRTKNGLLGLAREPFLDRITDSIPEPPANYGRIKQINRGFASIEEEDVEDLELGPNRCAAG